MEKLTKICTKCNCEKELTEFNKAKRSKDGFNNNCKICTREYMRNVKYKYDEKQKLYYEQNKESIALQKKERYIRDSDIIKLQVKNYRDNNKDKLLKRNRRYRENNKELVASKQKVYQRERYLENTEEILERNREYIKNNIEKSKQYHKNYRESPIGKSIEKNANHKRRIMYRDSDVTSRQLLELEQNATHCYWCETPLIDKVVHIDHYMPLKLGGKHTINNLVMTCSTCNLKKNAKHPLMFAKEIGKIL